jgi:hypothetical protein
MNSKHKNKNTMYKIVCTAAVVLMGIMRCIAAEVTQGDATAVGSGTDGCLGNYYALAKMTNSSGGFWLTPPTGTHTGTFTNASGIAASSGVVVIRKSDQTAWCTNKTSLTFPATNSSYELILYITSHTPPPTNGQPLSLQVTWR